MLRNVRALFGLAIVLLLSTTSDVHAQGVSGPTQTDAKIPSFESLFTNLPSDFRHLASSTNGVVIAGSGLLAIGVHSGDSEITREAAESSDLEEVLDSGEPIGGGLVQGGGALGIYLFGRFTHRTNTAILGADLIRAQIVNGTLTLSLKAAVNRERPDGSPYSFPSGHSSSSFATATVLARHFGWKVGVPAYAVASYVAASRLTENRHYLSDVLFGAGIGIVSGRAVTVGHGSQTFVVSPIAGRGVMGVSFTRAIAP
jgi:membrane-associated phospholipid phosphatase